MTQSRPAVGIVIPARNAARTLEAAVASALDQDYDGPIEVVVAIGPSHDDTEQLARSLEAAGRVRCVVNPLGTTPEGLNRAIRATVSPVIVRLDAHSRLHRHHVSIAVEILERTGAACVGGSQVPVADGGFAASVAVAMTSFLGSGGAIYRTGDTAQDSDTVYLGCFRRDALDAVGGFDPFFLRNQDYELNYRLRKAGWRVHFDPRLAVEYQPRDSLRALARQYWEYGAWKRAMLLRHKSALRMRQLAPPLLVTGTGIAVALAVGRRTLWPLVMPAAYTATVGAVSVKESAGRPGSWWGTAVAIMTIHWSWGAGFLAGSAGSSRSLGPR